MPFRVVSPRCEWDPINNQYFKYADVRFIEHIYGLDPYDPARFLWRRPVNMTGEGGKPRGATKVTKSRGELAFVVTFANRGLALAQRWGRKFTSRTIRILPKILWEAVLQKENKGKMVPLLISCIKLTSSTETLTLVPKRKFSPFGKLNSPNLNAHIQT